MSKLSRRLSAFTFGYILLGAALVLGACNGKKPGGSEGGDTPCTTAAACSGTQICDPGTSKCVDTLACTTHDQCGTAAYCDTAAGQCVRSVAGQANPCGGEANCAGTETCDAGHCGCGGEPYAPNKVVPNMLIVFDRTGSMAWSVDGRNHSPPTGQRKWDYGKQAINTMLGNTDFDDQIYFGLALYAGEKNKDVTDCTPDSAGFVAVYPGADTDTAIMDALNASEFCSRTPIGATLNAMRVTDTAWQDPVRPNYILLVTDGQENINLKTYPVEQAGLLHDEGINTYVIGFGTGSEGTDGVDAKTLDAIAKAGGTTSYHQADNGAELNAALATIVGSTLSCTYQLPETPPNVDKLYVYVTNGSGVETQLPRDTTHLNGWDYDSAANRVTVYGDACNMLQGGSAQNFSIVYGCPTGGMGG